MKGANTTAASGIAAVLLLLSSVANSNAQTESADSAAPAFEVISIKYSGTPADRMRSENGVMTVRSQPLQYQGVRLSGDTVIRDII